MKNLYARFVLFLIAPALGLKQSRDASDLRMHFEEVKPKILADTLHALARTAEESKAFRSGD